MNRALWSKTIHEAKWLLIFSAGLLFIFHWLRVWLTSQIQTTQMRGIFEYLPESWTVLLPVEISQLITPAGRIALAYDDPLVVMIISIFAIARGSDSVSGEIGRGTMEMVLAQPVRRFDVLFSHTAVTIVGIAILAICCLLGTIVGLSLITLEESVSVKIFCPAALNLFALGVFLSGLATMLSACDRYRWRTIGITVGIYVSQTMIKVTGLMAADLEWLRYATIMTAFEPQVMVGLFLPETLAETAHESWSILLRYNGLLIGVGAAAYAAAAVIFCRRDLPAPL